MAYNKGYNPDALPAHAEPDQAAALMSQNQTSSRPPRSSSALDYSKPQPPLPHAPSRNSRHDDHYGGGGPGGGPGGGGRHGRPGGYDDPRYGGGDGRPRFNSNGRADDPRWAGHAVSPAPPVNYGMRTPAPPRDGNDKDALWKLFGAVDKNRSGQLSEQELRAALVNGDWSAFDPHTVRMMIRMFDTDRSGTINFEEFCGLWGFLAAWRSLFDRFDLDRSGTIQYDEFSEALVAFGYRLSPQFVTLLFRTYDKRNDNAISFDLFVQACISLKRMTDVFKKYDEDRDGYITLSFEEFLTEIIGNR